MACWLVGSTRPRWTAVYDVLRSRSLRLRGRTANERVAHVRDDRGRHFLHRGLEGFTLPVDAGVFLEAWNREEPWAGGHSVVPVPARIAVVDESVFHRH